MNDFDALAAALKVAMHNFDYDEAQLIRSALADLAEEEGNLKKADLWRSIYQHWKQWIGARKLRMTDERE